MPERVIASIDLNGKHQIPLEQLSIETGFTVSCIVFVIIDTAKNHF